MARTKNSKAPKSATRSALGTKQARGGSKKKPAKAAAATAVASSTDVEKKERKPRRNRPGMLARRTVRVLCRSDTPCFQQAPFRRFVYDLMEDPSVRYTKRGLSLLQKGAEQVFTHFLQQCRVVQDACGDVRFSAQHIIAVRDIVQPLDTDLTSKLRRDLYLTRDLAMKAEHASLKRAAAKDRKEQEKAQKLLAEEGHAGLGIVFSGDGDDEEDEKDMLVIA